MNPNSLNTESVRQVLNRAANGLDNATLEKLHDARAEAMVRFDARHRTVPVFAWAGMGRFGYYAQNRIYFLAGAVLLAAVLFGAASYWQQSAERESLDVDLAILTDDVPMDVYIE
jgi:Protein of unknown function (DUF3619)